MLEPQRAEGVGVGQGEGLGAVAGGIAVDGEFEDVQFTVGMVANVLHRFDLHPLKFFEHVHCSAPYGSVLR